jgi:Ala-tRNA(Pro) deacylase
MFVSQTVMNYLDRSGVDFDLVMHTHTFSAGEIAKVAHIEPAKLAKAVLLRNEERYVLAAVPAARQVNPFAIRELLEGEMVTLAEEAEMPFIFRDCERGALPIVGAAFGVQTAVDDELLAASDVYFEAGDHEHLVHMTHDEFVHLMEGELHGHISCLARLI